MNNEQYRARIAELERELAEANAIIAREPIAAMWAIRNLWAALPPFEWHETTAARAAIETWLDEQAVQE